MKVVLISSPNKFKSEVKTVIELFRIGLETFHLRKPKFSMRKLTEYLRSIPKEYHNRIVIHSHYQLALRFKLKGIHLSKQDREGGFSLRMTLMWYRFRHPKLQLSTSYHSILSLLEDERVYEYVIISPVFSDLEDQRFNSSFGEEQLRTSLKRCKHHVLALGGVTADRIMLVSGVGFYGAALSGSIWELDSVDAQVKYCQNIFDVAEGRVTVLPDFVLKPVKIDLKPSRKRR